MSPTAAIPVLLVLGVVLASCQKALRDAGTNRWPARGLATVTVAVMLAVVGDVLLPLLKVPALGAFALYAWPACAAVGAGIAVYGLFRGTPPGGSPGRGRAIAAVLLAGAFVAIFVPNFLHASKGHFPPEMISADQGRAERIEADLNFRLVPPPEPWIVLDASRLNANAAYGQADTLTIVSVNAVKAGPGRFDSRSFAALLHGKLSEKATRSGAITDAVLDGLPGAQFELLRPNPVTGDPVLMAVRTLERNGYCYALQAVGPADQERRVRDTLEEFTQRFALVDPARVASP